MGDTVGSLQLCGPDALPAAHTLLLVGGASGQPVTDQRRAVGFQRPPQSCLPALGKCGLYSALRSYVLCPAPPTASSPPSPVPPPSHWDPDLPIYLPLTLGKATPLLAQMTKSPLNWSPPPPLCTHWCESVFFKAILIIPLPCLKPTNGFPSHTA